MSENIYDMDLHEVLWLDSKNEVQRVHCGWVYKHREPMPPKEGSLMVSYQVSQVFVPWPGKV